jgi:hypothetical protein
MRLCNAENKRTAMTAITTTIAAVFLKKPLTSNSMITFLDQLARWRNQKTLYPAIFKPLREDASPRRQKNLSTSTVFGVSGGSGQGPTERHNSDVICDHGPEGRIVTSERIQSNDLAPDEKSAVSPRMR